MKERKEPWSDEVRVSKGDFQPYVRFSDLVRSEQFKKTMELWEKNKRTILNDTTARERHR